ncbi:hypothetical protein EV183_005593 [Coemansia sp. RSA 2336]|nr:hypothetical protein EV183_005593 [Coemansia sp. RSA 2336]
MLAEDESLRGLQHALTQTNSTVAQANLHLAINLHKRYQAEQQQYQHELSQYQQTLALANTQYTQALQSQSKDISKLNQPARALPDFRRRKGDRERLEFSNMMVEDARKRVHEAEAALHKLVKEKEEYLKRLEAEVRLAEQACRDTSGVDRCKPARPPVPQARPSRSVGSKPPLPRVTITPAPPQPPHKPAKPAQNTLLLPQAPLANDPPFSIESEDRQQSSLVTSQQRRLQSQMPPQLLVELAAMDNTHDVTAEQMSRRLFDMWPHIHRMLSTCFVAHREGQVRLLRGRAGFGADAYLELESNQQQLIRVPFCIVGGRLDTCGILQRVRIPKRSRSEQAVLMSFGPHVVSFEKSGSCGWQRAALAVLYLVKLISTEARARNAGILVTPHGWLFVRRTRRQAALVSRLYPFTSAAGKSCHPLVALGWFVAQLLAAAPVEMKPPCISALE